jgi:hypothetical protein
LPIIPLPFPNLIFNSSDWILFNTMKTVTIREFYHDARLVDVLAVGEQLLVTANAKPKFVVSKSSRPKMSRQLAEQRAVGDAKAPSFNGAAFLSSLKK